MPTSITSDDRGRNEFSTPSTTRTFVWQVALQHCVAADAALARMNDAGLRAFTALHVAGNKPYAACAAVSGATIVRQVNAVFQSLVEQQLAKACVEAFAINRNLMGFLCPSPYPFPPPFFFFPRAFVLPLPKVQGIIKFAMVLFLWFLDNDPVWRLNPGRMKSGGLRADNLGRYRLFHLGIPEQWAGAKDDSSFCVGGRKMIAVASFAVQKIRFVSSNLHGTEKKKKKKKKKKKRIMDLRYNSYILYFQIMDSRR